jgi:hypothetical protein
MMVLGLLTFLLLLIKEGYCIPDSPAFMAFEAQVCGEVFNPFEKVSLSKSVIVRNATFMYSYEEFGQNHNYQFHDKSTKSTVKIIYYKK